MNPLVVNAKAAATAADANLFSGEVAVDRADLSPRTFQLWIGDAARYFEAGYDGARTEFLARLQSTLATVNTVPETGTMN